MSNPAEFFASDVDARLGALAHTVPSGDGAWVVRDVLLSDEHADVRAAAAEWLGRAPGLTHAVGAALVDALYDTHPSVRLSACRAIARARVDGAAPLLSRLVREEPIWWVRRGAVVALARRERRAAIPTLLEVLDDPFWRVRHAAVRVLAALGDDLALLTAEGGRSERARAAVSYLAGRLGLPREGLVGSDARPVPEGALADGDPAVIAARLERGQRATNAELVEYLGDSHESLRRAASKRLASSGDVRALLAATLWLSEPRIPHAAATVVRLLDRLEGTTCDELLNLVLAQPDARPGAAVWALSFLEPRLRDGSENRLAAVLAASRAASPTVRRAATSAVGARLAAVPEDAAALACLSRALGDDDEDVRRIAAHALVSSESEDASRAVVLAAEGLLAEGSALVARQVARAAERIGDVASLAQIARTDDSAARAIALGALFARGLIDTEALHRARESEDPWTRGAVVDDDHALEVLVSDPHPPLRRAAFLRAARSGRALDAARIAADADDAWLRVRAAERLARSVEPADVELVFTLLFDPEPAVRAAAADATLHSQAIRDRLAARAAAALAARETPADDVRATALPTPPPPKAVPVASPRALGRSGLVTAPLVLSGANEPSVASLFGALDAGCNLFFWEPRYRAMTTFLREAARRGRAPLVVAGSYHASERAILADVDRARRLLERDRIDVFLVFWARSPARLEGDAPRALTRAKARGLVAAAGFSTHDRELALSTLGGAFADAWDVIMIRHSAAHPGAEERLLPAAAARGVGVLGFSATSYGRMLRPASSRAASLVAGALPSAAECYRYSLSQPGVCACVSAPRGGVELVENLEVLKETLLPAERLAELRAHGQAIRAESLDFARHVRRFPALPDHLERDLERDLDETLASVDESHVAADNASA
jgi:HEAT repeat protein/diketogulonate reductase-like aldo/keto reductase